MLSMLIYAVDRGGTQSRVALVVLLHLFDLFVVFLKVLELAEHAGETMHDAARVGLSS